MSCCSMAVARHLTQINDTKLHAILVGILAQLEIEWAVDVFIPGMHILFRVSNFWRKCANEIVELRTMPLICIAHRFTYMKLRFRGLCYVPICHF